MRFFVFFVLTFFSFVWVFAGNEKARLDIDLRLHGKHVGSPQILTSVGDSSFFSHQFKNNRKTVMEVQTQKNTNDDFRMKFIISEIIGGKAQVISSPEIRTQNKKMAEFSLKDERNREILKIVVTPEEIKDPD